ncbi:hypothetical protein R5R35_007729 [Gryllus longicercus]|uniref:Homologous-pairing protein 2 homolog n=1 Tax=Gryllus longicercus TaxID=2509291 RepID=A0AAN9V8C1_9ORTH
MGADEAVLKYLVTQNRPYSANDIFMNLHKEYGKTAVQKSLDVLVEKGSIKEKVYGKQKVYSVQQKMGISSDEVSKVLEDLDKRIGQASEKLSLVEQELHTSEALLRNLVSSPTTENAIKDLDVLQNKVDKLKEKLKNLSQTSVPISKKDFEETKKEHERMTKEWRKRKSTCMSIVNSILESYPKTKKELLDDIGIETDEDVGISQLL